MRVLITWGSKRGGTEGIARVVAEALAEHGHQVSVTPAREVRDISTYDALVIGGALYANRWHRDARSFVARNISALRRIPVWCFSSGPLDHSAEQTSVPPCRDVAVLMDRIGACGHMTFGGRLDADARGFPASAMAKERNGDYRNPERIRSWALALAEELPLARPGIAVDPPGASLARLLAHALTSGLLCVGTLALLVRFAAPTLTAAVHAIAALAVLVAVARHYFRVRGAREALPAALTFAAVAWLLDSLLVAGVFDFTFSPFASLTLHWLPLSAIFLATWATGSILAMMPEPGAGTRRRTPPRVGDDAPSSAA